MRSYLYNAVLNQQTMHNELVKEREIDYGMGNVTSPDKVHQVMTEIFNLHQMAEEYVYMIALNTKARPLGFFEISHGTVNLSLITPREVFIRAVLVGATGIIISHNHPSGDCSPSVDDLKITRRLKDAGDLLGIKLFDHVIIGGMKYCSLKESEII